MAQACSTPLYDADTLLLLTHQPVVYGIVKSLVPQQELSREQAYWLPANERASKIVTPIDRSLPTVLKVDPPSQVLAVFEMLMLAFPQFEGIIIKKEQHKLWCFDYAKQTSRRILKQIFDLILGGQSVMNNKDICSIVLTSDIVVPPSSNCLCEDLRSACDREHTKVLKLEAEISKQKQLITDSEKSSRKDDSIRNLVCPDQIMKGAECTVPLKVVSTKGFRTDRIQLKDTRNTHSRTAYTEKLLEPSLLKIQAKAQGDWSKERPVADSIAARLTRPTAYILKTDCSIQFLSGILKDSYECSCSGLGMLPTSEVIPLKLKLESLGYEWSRMSLREKYRHKFELTLEQSQQGVSNDVLVSIEGVEELKRNVWIKGEKKEALLTP
ncbi:hypothetical protein Tco_0990381 [Tanacetum coccineum]|uniref:Uncharacterized protein n=1 Tax=Tanacetum coccineum TaxID=301880 RepID=A0ABQ5EXP5_9ASTR